MPQGGGRAGARAMAIEAQPGEDPPAGSGEDGAVSMEAVMERPTEAAAPAEVSPAEPEVVPAEAGASVAEAVASPAEAAEAATGSTAEAASEEAAAPATAAAAAAAAAPASPRDEAARPEVQLRPLTYAWEQTDEEVKVYVPFDQCPEELERGLAEDDISIEYGEWSLLLLIPSKVEGRMPLGLRLGDFQQRIDPERCNCAVRSSRLTLKLRKREKEHWFKLCQRKGK